MGFNSVHRVRFQETDAAGVVYFANGLALCHGAYEDSLQAIGVNLTDFFSGSAEVAYPIVHARVDYHRPMRCGDLVTIALTPTRLDDFSFEIEYRLHHQAQPTVLLAQALTRHLCIHPNHRTRLPLPAIMEAWLDRWSNGASQTPED